VFEFDDEDEEEVVVLEVVAPMFEKVEPGDEVILWAFCVGCKTGVEFAVLFLSEL
jgi:hypothetical protein